MWSPFNPETMWERMLGGGETALIMASKAMAEAGHKVHIYVPGGKGTFNGVVWHDLGERIRDCDVLISWESDEEVGPIETETRILAAQCNDPIITNRVDYFVSPSVWHGRHINRQFGIMSEKFRIIPNGIHPELYDKKIEKIPGRLIYSSSPDRGLNHLLRIFPEIRKRVPRAHLKVFYAFQPQFEANKWGMHLFSEMYWNIKIMMQQDGVEHVGPVGKRQLAEEQLKSELMVYPEETLRPTEGFGITYAEALAAKVAIIGSDVDAVGEIWGDYIALMPPPPFIEKDWIELTVELLESPKKRRKYYEAGREKVLKDYNWGKVGEHWIKLLEEIK